MAEKGNISNSTPPRFIISGGGTGGHIFPAIAIANALKRLRPDAEILFVGALGKMEMEKVPAAGYRIIGLNISGIERSLSPKNLLFPFKLGGSLLQSVRILREFKPDAVIGVGGFASGPVMLAASLRGIPTLIQEQNSYAGITNKVLGKRAKRICVAYPDMERFFPSDRIVLTGNPVRQDILSMEGKREAGQKTFNLDPAKKTLLVIGGSLGARSINLSVEAHIEAFIKADVQVVWQTGKLFIEQALKAVETKGAENFRVQPFITTMDQAYAVADVVLSRAGASSISELCIVGKPSVLVPFPFAAEDHQTKNAMALVKRNAAILVPDSKAKDEACQQALALLDDDARRNELSANIRELALPNADTDIAEEVLRISNSKVNRR
jgi:UDP-N-acetylglucosamine--N-acetylmuramyl-(pentapeptide) pyrophosphoryl-undecaprenol N-acetylglucosamine transferase